MFCEGHYIFARQLKLVFCKRWGLNSKKEIHWKGVSEGDNSLTVNGVHCLSEVSCVRSVVGKVFHIVDEMQECCLNALRRRHRKQISVKSYQQKLPEEELVVFPN